MRPEGINIFDKELLVLKKRLFWSMPTGGGRSLSLHGIHIRQSNDETVYLATDGHRLTAVSLPFESNPLGALERSGIGRWFLPQTCIEQALYWNEIGHLGHVNVEPQGDDGRTVCTVWHSHGKTGIEADFPEPPEFEQVIEAVTRINPEAILSSRVGDLKAALKSISRTYDSVELVASVDGVRLLGKVPKNPDKNPSVSPLQASAAGSLLQGGEGARVAASCKYLSQALSSLRARDTVRVELRGALEPIVLSADGFFQILMPMRV